MVANARELTVRVRFRTGSLELSEGIQERVAFLRGSPEGRH